MRISFLDHSQGASGLGSIVTPRGASQDEMEVTRRAFTRVMDVAVRGAGYVMAHTSSADADAAGGAATGRSRRRTSNSFVGS